MNAIEFKKHGHIENGKRDEAGYLVCVNCGVSVGSIEGQSICHKAEYIHREVMNREIQRIVGTFGGGKSGHKLSKKVNKLYRKQMEKVVETKANELYKNFEEHIKPCPKIVPKKLWRAMGSIFIEGLM